MPGQEQYAIDRSIKDDARLSGVVTIGDIMSHFEGQWVVMRVTEHDDDAWPAKGYVLAHAPCQRDALAALAKLPSDQRGAAGHDHPLYSFRVQPDISPGPEYDALLARLRSDLTPPQ